jgi:hypothetical protein
MIAQKRKVVCTRGSLRSAVRDVEEWLAEGRSELLQHGRSYALTSPAFLRKHYTSSPVVQRGLERLRGCFTSPSVGTEAQEHYQRLRQTLMQFRRQIEQSAGEERLRAGYLAGLEGTRATRRRPKCRYVWVRSHYRS